MTLSRKLLSLLLLLASFSISVGFAASSDEARIFNRQGVLLAQRGDPEAALAAFETAAAADPYDFNARSNLATAFNNFGVHLFQNGDNEKALKLFEKARCQKPEDLQVRLNLLAVLVSMRDAERVDREARSLIALRPNDPTTILKVANAFQKIEDPESARNLLERILSEHPENDRALFSLGRLYYYQGKLSDAKYYLELAFEASPANSSAKSLLNRISKENELEKHYQVEESVHFSLTFEEKIPHELVLGILEVAEEAFSNIGDVFEYYPSQRSHLIAYLPKDFNKVSSLPLWAGGSYDGKIRIPLSPNLKSAQQLRGAIFHEYTHHVVHSLTEGKCPIWLNEGLAQYFEGIKGSQAFSILAKNSRLLSQEQLEKTISDEDDRSIAELFYAQALAMTLIIIEEKGLGTIQDMLKESRPKKDFDSLLSNHTGFSAKSLVSRLSENIDRM